MSTAKAALIEGFKSEHAHMDAGLATLTDALDRLRVGVDPALVRTLAETEKFLRQVLIPHAEWEELTFYPAVGELLRKHGDVNAGMFIDHREIMSRIKTFLGLIKRVQAGERDPELLDQVRILGYQIRALEEVHTHKEEEVYVALLQRHLSDREAVNVLAVGDQMGHD